MSYYLGIDGGGTKTQYALFDEHKNMLSTVKTAGSNHENLEGGVTQAADIIMEGINSLLMENVLMPNSISCILMALAGIDHPYQEAAMREALTSRGLHVPFRIYNDGFIVVKAGITGKAGIGYNCGTGTCCNSVGSDGRLLQIGGFGQLSGDVGGGLWIAAEAYRLAYDEICLGLQPTACTKLICEKFGIAPERDALLSLIPRYEAEDKEYIHDMIDVFFDALAAGDARTAEVAERMADRGAQFIAGHIHRQRFDDEVIEVVLSGSMHTKLVPDSYIDMLQKKTEAYGGRKCKFIKLTVPPVTGCINWLLEDGE